MNDDELVAFNPILARAVHDAENPNSRSNAYWGLALVHLREMVAVAVQAGVEPSKIYAMIQTGRMLTGDNMKFLSKADIKEWADATREYDQLANPKTTRRKK
jgi:hypothetical protein